VPAFVLSQYALLSKIFEPRVLIRAFEEAIEELKWDVQLPHQDQMKPKKAAQKGKVGTGPFQRDGSSGTLPVPCTG
jgi:hypothetical protein